MTPRPAGPLEQHVQQVAGGQGVVEGAVGRPVGEAEALGEGAEPAVRHLVAHQAAGQGAGVDRPVGEAGAGRCARARRRGSRGRSGRCGRRSPRRRRTRAASGSTASMRGAGSDHRLGDAGEHGDLRAGWPGPGLTRVWNVPRHSPPRSFTAPISVMPPSAGGAAGGLEVDHAERDLVQRRAEVVEASAGRVTATAHHRRRTAFDVQGFVR